MRIGVYISIPFALKRKSLDLSLLYVIESIVPGLVLLEEGVDAGQGGGKHSLAKGFHLSTRICKRYDW